MKKLKLKFQKGSVALKVIIGALLIVFGVGVADYLVRNYLIDKVSFNNFETWSLYESTNFKFGTGFAGASKCGAGVNESAVIIGGNAISEEARYVNEIFSKLDLLDKKELVLIPDVLSLISTSDPIFNLSGKKQDVINFRDYVWGERYISEDCRAHIKPLFAYNDRLLWQKGVCSNPGPSEGFNPTTEEYEQYKKCLAYERRKGAGQQGKGFKETQVLCKKVN